MVIDFHAHVGRRSDDPDVMEGALLEDMDRNGIDLRVVSALEGWETVEGNEYVSSLVSRHPGRLVGCAIANPKERDCGEKARRALDLPGMALVEMSSFEHGYYPDSCEGVEEVLAVAEERGVPVKVFTGIGCRSMPQQWMGHVRRHPGIPFIFLHMGCFDYGYGCIDLVKEADNLYLETSNQYELQILRKAVAQVSPSRMVFGSMWPSRLTKCSLDVFDTLEVDEEFRREVFGGTAECILRESGALDNAVPGVKGDGNEG